MQAVDILVAARELIADKKNWVQEHLHRVKKGQDCYCSVGAVFWAGGLMRKHGGPTHNSCWLGSYGGIEINGKTPDRLSHHDIISLAAEDVFPKQTATAIKYLNAAATQLMGECSDLDWGQASMLNDNGTHKGVMNMFDLAIKNCKRRHVLGGSYKDGSPRHKKSGA